MRLGELQVNDKRNSQLMYSIGQVLREKSTPDPLRNITYLPSREILMNKWKLRHDFKYVQFSNMQDGE